MNIWHTEQLHIAHTLTCVTWLVSIAIDSIVSQFNCNCYDSFSFSILILFSFYSILIHKSFESKSILSVIITKFTSIVECLCVVSQQSSIKYSMIQLQMNSNNIVVIIIINNININTVIIINMKSNGINVLMISILHLSKFHFWNLSRCPLPRCYGGTVVRWYAGTLPRCPAATLLHFEKYFFVFVIFLLKKKLNLCKTCCYCWMKCFLIKMLTNLTMNERLRKHLSSNF